MVKKQGLHLAKTIVSKANFLMLDEPTNHLDMHSCDLLIEALNKYEGSFILVSHDRYFISKTANKIWEIVDHKIKEFKGGYEEWVEWKERMQKRAEEKIQQDGNKKTVETKPVEKKIPPKEIAKPKEQKGQVINKDHKKELQKQQKLFQQLEEKIAVLQKKKSELEGLLTAPDTYSDKNKFLETETAYKKVSDELNSTNKEYEKVFDKIVTLEGNS